MKRIITVVLLLLNSVVYGQYSSLNVFPADNTVLASFENINNDGFGIQIGGYYKIGSTQSPYIYRTPYMYFNSIGVNYGFLHSGLVVGAGIKVDLISGPDPLVYPDLTIKFQPIKLLTKKRDIWDVSVMCDISNKLSFGFGISIPYRYGTYYR